MSDVEYEATSNPDPPDSTVIKQKATKTGWRLTAACPRCTHPISTFVAKQGYVVGLLPGGGDHFETPAVETFRCNCASPHTGRPKGAHGCGYYWSFEIST